MPLAVLERLKPVPSSYLKQISRDVELFRRLPVEVQRQCWELKGMLLRRHATPCLLAYGEETATTMRNARARARARARSTARRARCVYPPGAAPPGSEPHGASRAVPGLPRRSLRRADERRPSSDRSDAWSATPRRSPRRGRVVRERTTPSTASPPSVRAARSSGALHDDERTDLCASDRVHRLAWLARACARGRGAWTAAVRRAVRHRRAARISTPRRASARGRPSARGDARRRPRRRRRDARGRGRRRRAGETTFEGSRGAQGDVRAREKGGEARRARRATTTPPSNPNPNASPRRFDRWAARLETTRRNARAVHGTRPRVPPSRARALRARMRTSSERGMIASRSPRAEPPRLHETVRTLEGVVEAEHARQERAETRGADAVPRVGVRRARAPAPRPRPVGARTSPPQALTERRRTPSPRRALGSSTPCWRQRRRGRGPGPGSGHRRDGRGDGRRRRRSIGGGSGFGRVPATLSRARSRSLGLVGRADASEIRKVSATRAASRATSANPPRRRRATKRGDEGGTRARGVATS